jgi:hypothetical protein
MIKTKNNFINTFVYKKKQTATGNYKVVPKTDEFNPPKEMMEEGNFEKVTKKIDVWYDGIMVMGTNIILKWEMAKNMVRPKSDYSKVKMNYSIVKNSCFALASRVT